MMPFPFWGKGIGWGTAFIGERGNVKEAQSIVGAACAVTPIGKPKEVAVEVTQERAVDDDPPED